MRAPVNGAAGTVYARSGPDGPSKDKAVIHICNTAFPQVLDSKVERMFREKGWKIIWTPPYCPKFQPIELVWGVGKQRAGTLYFKGRDLKTTREHLRRGWYGGKGSDTKNFEPCNVRGCLGNCTHRDELVDQRRFRAQSRDGLDREVGGTAWDSNLDEHCR